MKKIVRLIVLVKTDLFRETKRDSKKRYSKNLFVEPNDGKNRESNIKFNLIVHKYHSQLIKNVIYVHFIK